MIANAEVVLVLSFGGRESGQGLTNKYLANIISQKTDLPIVAQNEIAEILQDESVYCEYVIKEHQTYGAYLDTYEVLRQSFEYCKTKGWRNALIIAHSDHLWRAVETAKKIGFHATAADTKMVPYDKKSNQLWTRNRSLFISREILTRIMYLAKGWI